MAIVTQRTNPSAAVAGETKTGLQPYHWPMPEPC